MTYEAYREAWLRRERETDADLRRGVIMGEQFPYRYVGPPLVHTPDHVIERAWLDSVRSRATAWCKMLTIRALTIDDPPPAITEFGYLRGILADLALRGP